MTGEREAFRLLCQLPHPQLSLGTTGVPERNLVRLLGPATPGLLRDLAAEGLVAQLDGGGWVRRDTP